VAFRYQGLLALLDGRIDEAETLLRTSLIKGREQKLGLAILEENRQVRGRFRDDVQESPDSDSRAKAWAQGHAMTLEQAVAYALTGEAVAV
jgi:hypothetical protein